MLATVTLWVASYQREIGVLRRSRASEGGGRFDWFVVARGRLDCTATFQADPRGWDDTLPRWQLTREPLEQSDDEEGLWGFRFHRGEDGMTIAIPGLKWVNVSMINVGMPG